MVSTPPAALLGLAVVWAAGLAAHTVALASALPGLTHRRAFLLSLTGSAVANVLPLGGAAGIALNYRMSREWGFSPASCASYTVVTNLWDVFTKLFLPILVVPLLFLGLPVSHGLGEVITGAVFALPLAAGMAVALLARPQGRGRLGERFEKVRISAAATVSTAWRRLTIGMAMYTTLLFILLVASLAAAGARVPLGVVLLAFCAERLASLAGVTPGGLGLVELGLAGTLMLAPGASSAGVGAGALLYRVFTFGLDIPVGGLLLAAWTWRRRELQ
jgi:uncharacterized membrane protein YbhN (UPF0104 family)